MAIVIIKEFSPAEALALAKFDADAYREKIGLGKHDVDLRVLVSGAITVSPGRSEKQKLGPGDLYRLLQAARGNLKRGLSLDQLVAQAMEGEAPSESFCTWIRELVRPFKRMGTVSGAVHGDLEFRRLA